MENEEFLIRVVAPDELEETFHLTTAEKHSVMLNKFVGVGKLFPLDVFVTIKTNTKEVVATASVIPSRPGHRVLVNVAVKRAYRKQGLGRKLLENAIHRYPEDKVVLRSVPEAVHFYRKLGFETVEPFYLACVMELDRTKLAISCSDCKVNDNDITIKTYDVKQLLELGNYYKQTTGYSDAWYLPVAIQTSDHFLVATSKRSGKVVGHVSGIDLDTYLLVDGLYADSDEIALQLFRELLKSFPDIKEVKIQTVESREFLLQFGDDIKEKCTTYTRMVTGPVGPLPLSNLYALFDRYID